jgi:hypothetical protein
MKASEKTVQKMSRDGLVEQNLSTGASERVSKREQDFKVSGSADGRKTPEQAQNRPAVSQSHANIQTAATAALHKTDTPTVHNPRAGPEAQNTQPTTPAAQENPRVRYDKQGAGTTPDTARPPDHGHKPRFKPDADTAATATTPAVPAAPPAVNKPPGDTPNVKYTRESKLRHAEAKLERTEKKLDKVRKKQPHKKRLVSEIVVDEKTQKPKKRLFFEDVPAAAKKPKLITTGVKAAGGMAALGIHRKLYQVERENVGVQAAHKSEIAGETALRAASRYRRMRPQRLAKKRLSWKRKR